MKINQPSLLIQTPVKVLLQKLEGELSQSGYTLGYHPVREKELTLEEALVERIPNRCALKYGEIDDICVAVKIRRGEEIFTTRNVPRSATGPDFKKIFAGGLGGYGEILEATLKMVPLPERKAVHRFQIKREKRENFLKKLWASGIGPARIELTKNGVTVHLEGMSDIVETEEGCLKRIFHAPS